MVFNLPVDIFQDINDTSLRQHTVKRTEDTVSDDTVNE